MDELSISRLLVDAMDDVKRNVESIRSDVKADNKEVMNKIIELSMEMRDMDSELGNKLEELDKRIYENRNRFDSLKAEIDEVKMRLKIYTAVLTGIIGTLLFFGIPDKIKAILNL